VIRVKLEESDRMTLEELAAHHRHDDTRRRARGLLALGKGHRIATVAEIFGVTSQCVRNWVHHWTERGADGLLLGHKGGRPAKLTVELLATGKKLALAQPMTLREIAAGIRAAHPDAPSFSLDRLSAGLKAQGLSFKRTRLSLKKNTTPRPSPTRGTP
jgi:transposase